MHFARFITFIDKCVSDRKHLYVSIYVMIMQSFNNLIYSLNSKLGFALIFFLKGVCYFTETTCHFRNIFGK